MPGAAEDDFDVILRVAPDVSAVHEAEDVGHAIAEEVQRLVERVRAGVHQVARVHRLDRLPVPAPAEAVEGDGDLDDPAEHAERMTLRTCWKYGAKRDC